MASSKLKSSKFAPVRMQISPPHQYSFAEGTMHPGDAPGLGVDIDESLAAKFPHHRPYLPVNRKPDGTAHKW